MNNLSGSAKLVIVLLLGAILLSLGNCAMRQARTAIRLRRVDGVEQLVGE